MILARYIPYQGLRKVDSVKTGGVIDFAVFNNRMIGDELHIYVLEENFKSKMYKLMTKDYVPRLSISYGKVYVPTGDENDDSI